MGCELAVWCDWAAYSLENGWMSFIYCTPLRVTMMTRGEMRIRPEETGPTNWILFCPWLAMRWDWETCGGSLISLSKMVEVRQEFLGQWFLFFIPGTQTNEKRDQNIEVCLVSIRYYLYFLCSYIALLMPDMFSPMCLLVFFVGL